MKAQQFNLLSESEKARIILSKGVYISKSEFFHLEISLYRVGADFLELWYAPASRQIVKIDQLKNKKVNPYLKHLCSGNLN